MSLGINDAVIERQPTLDHVIPLSKGGEDSPDNIVVACRHCNDVRGNRRPDRIPACLAERLERKRLRDERERWENPRYGEDEEWEDT